jgi:regulator of nucleoside diphosphate kinase
MAHFRSPTTVKRKDQIMSTRMLYITEKDHRVLEEYIDRAKRADRNGRDTFARLEDELDCCCIVSPQEVPPNVITLNTKVRFRYVNTGQEITATLVFPHSANLAEGRISVDSPIGTAILGYAAGDVIERQVLAGTKTIQIEEILYQPEAAGDYHL